MTIFKNITKHFVYYLKSMDHIILDIFIFSKVEIKLFFFRFHCNMFIVLELITKEVMIMNILCLLSVFPTNAF